MKYSKQYNLNNICDPRVIQDHKVNGLFTAPTALRVIKREDPVLEYGCKYNTKS